MRPASEFQLEVPILRAVKRARSPPGYGEPCGDSSFTAVSTDPRYIMARDLSKQQARHDGAAGLPGVDWTVRASEDTVISIEHFEH
ncbi:hypothetical protein BV25DRAFT_1256045 [Artomyces pyxidatus]|uniref:Uncharacterized protein n=1 Tax=Artomyces pyxidatus TaxID=48021 RepID=A0ACB8TEP4_9AGAM|nr:hypothetical protein BV25DRAFT_1256045 [Artomyces pyxidatus]